MSVSAKPDKGSVEINADECKGCGLCIAACALGVLAQAEALNRYGYHPAVYAGHGCNGCGLCFYACPEPGAITVYKRTAVPSAPTRELVAV
ncbi:MAG TPA: 4Fe-4S dicluster domain-containing protein [Bryobacteraceae bacterium]|nr:4Fe-4S dicluster domain-containing protein [Bryobacteraceae bacterium]